MRGLPWFLAVLFALLSALLALGPARGTGRASDEVDAGRSGPLLERAPVSPDEIPPGLHLCRQCTERLASATAGLEACRAEEDPAPGAGGAPPAALACLAEPEVQGAVEARVDEAVAGCVEAEARRRITVDAEQARLVHRLLGETLEMTDEQSRWVAEYVCTIHELRRNAMSDMNEEGGPTAAETLARIHAERQEHLADLERTLGADRYARLRSIGGLGLLGDVLDCGEPAEP